MRRVWWGGEWQHEAEPAGLNCGPCGPNRGTGAAPTGVWRCSESPHWRYGFRPNRGRSGVLAGPIQKKCGAVPNHRVGATGVGAAPVPRLGLKGP